MSDYEVYAAAIDAYLDGRLTRGQRAELERRAAADPRLAEELGLQRRIDERLRSLMAVPAAPDVSGRAARRGSSPRVAGRLMAIPTWAKIAAVVVLVALGVWGAVARPWETLLRRPSDFAANVVLTKIVRGGFRPTWVCDTDAKFIAYTKEKLGVSFLIKPPAGVQLVGWSYFGGLLDQTAQVLLVKINDRPAIVVMGPRSEDRTMRLDAAAPPGSHLYRSVYKGIVMYELSQSDKPVILPYVTNP